MNKERLVGIAEDFIARVPENYISEELALSEEVIGLKLFEAPILAFASADDEYFQRLKEPSAIGPHFIAPREWLPRAETVVSFFLPFTEAVRREGYRDPIWPSYQWLHGRIEGQVLVNKLALHLQEALEDAGFPSLVPGLDPRFWSNTDGPDWEVKFTCNWSERHVAFVCGLGTFGLSGGVITSKGMAGRFGSVVTELSLPAEERAYEKLYEYCTMCGKCAKNCPVHAISKETGKDHEPCSQLIDRTKAKYDPRYGCGKCQVWVPCESRIPQKNTT